MMFLLKNLNNLVSWQGNVQFTVSSKAFTGGKFKNAASDTCATPATKFSHDAYEPIHDGVALAYVINEPKQVVPFLI